MMNTFKIIQSLQRNFLLPLVVFIFSATTYLYGQLRQFTLQGREYRLEGQKWYAFFEGKKGDEIIPHRLIVRLKDKGFVENIDFQRLNVSGITLGSERFLDGFYVLTIAPDQNPFQIASALEASGKFDVLEFDVIGQRNRIPSDPLYSQQWNLTRIQMPSAWDITAGNSSIILGIIDSGIRYTHEDIDGNIWVNQSEDRNGNGRPDFISVVYGGDLDGVDNDNNGFVDDLIGWDFADDDNNPDDTYGHGTNVAGVSSAQTNNYESGSYRGIAGVSGGWENQKGVSLMVLRDGGANPIVSLTSRAIEYAARNGSRVINISSSFWPEPTVLTTAVNFAVNTYSVVIVASAGNNGNTGDPSIRYPARYLNTIAVGATDQNDNRRSYSAYGPELDVVAPDGVPSTTIAGGYTSNVAGTSFSAPHVAGIAALILSVNPSLTWYQVRDIIRASADKVPGMGGQNRTDEYGYGRVNAYQALLLALAYANKSTDGGATNPNNVRQIAYGYGGQKLYLVFASGGEIFFRRSTDNGVSWDITKRLSTGDGNNCEPTITVHPYSSSSLTTTDGIHVVWSRRVNGNTFDIYYTKSFDFGQTWSNPVKVVSNVVISSYQFLPWPVIAGVSYQEGVNNLPRGMLPPSYVRALVLVFVDQNGLKWMYSEEPYTYWYGPYSLSSTAPGYFIWYPSVASYSGDSPFLYLTYDARFLHKIYSRFFNVETFSWSDEAIVYAYEYRGSGTDTLTYPRHSCVSVGMIHSKYAVWMGWDNIIQKWAIGFRAGNFSKDNTWSDWMWRYFELLNSLWYPLCALIIVEGHIKLR
jgi:subtilisin family serine protease